MAQLEVFAAILILSLLVRGSTLELAQESSRCELAGFQLDTLQE